MKTGAVVKKRHGKNVVMMTGAVVEEELCRSLVVYFGCNRITEQESYYRSIVFGGQCKGGLCEDE